MEVDGPARVENGNKCDRMRCCTYCVMETGIKFLGAYMTWDCVVALLMITQRYFPGTYWVDLIQFVSSLIVALCFWWVYLKSDNIMARKVWFQVVRVDLIIRFALVFAGGITGGILADEACADFEGKIETGYNEDC